jgi:hypothetical protein
LYSFGSMPLRQMLRGHSWHVGHAAVDAKH